MDSICDFIDRVSSIIVLIYNYYKKKLVFSWYSFDKLEKIVFRQNGNKKFKIVYVCKCLFIRMFTYLCLIIKI